MLGPGAELALVTVAAEVVTLAELAAHHLLGVIPGQTLALAADAVAAIVAQGLNNQSIRRE